VVFYKRIFLRSRNDVVALVAIASALDYGVPPIGISIELIVVAVMKDKGEPVLIGEVVV